MGFLIFILLPFLFIIINFILSCFCCKVKYYIIDTIILAAAFIYGSIDSWGSFSFSITNLCSFYCFFRGCIVLFIFLKNKLFWIKVKKFNDNKTTNILIYILMSVNILINLIFAAKFVVQFFTHGWG
jgi:hypothetical protein